MALSPSAKPGDAEYYARPVAQRGRAYQQAVAAGRQVFAHDYFTEAELKYLGLPTRQQVEEYFRAGAPAVPPPEQQPPFDLASLFGGGGGGGGTIIMPAQTPAGPPTPRNDAEAEEYVRQHYGMYAWLLDHAELGPLLRQAAKEGWPDDRIDAAVRQTEWWKSTTDAQRRWDALYATNPGEAARIMNQTAIEIAAMFRSYGLPVENNIRILELTAAATRNGWSAQELRRAVVSEVQWNPQTGAQGILGGRTVEVARAASEYGIPLSTEAAFYLARQIEMGDIDPLAVEDQFRDQAAVLYPHLAPRLQTGATVRQIAEPYVQTAAQLLELDPSRIDIADPKWSRALSFNDGKQIREMALDEWRRTLMNDEQYGWVETMNAKEAAYGLIGQLAQTMGVR